MTSAGRLEGLLRRDRLVTITALVAVSVVGWLYTLLGIGMPMTVLEITSWPWSLPPMAMSGGKAMALPAWTIGYGLLMLGMWWFMMMAMMLPSAAPTILLAAAINRRSQMARPPFAATGWFVAGYLAIWLIFSLIAVFAQWLLEQSDLLSAMMVSNSRLFSGMLLIMAGIWQWTPIKQACLRHCRSPVHFITTRRGQGDLGALLMGLEHGAYCLSCCWFLMVLLFVGGVMNLLWIAGLALFVLFEKIARDGVRFGKISGIALIGAGLVVLIVRQ